MMISSTDITNMYNTLYDATIDKYDAQYASNKIDAEKYAELVGSAATTIMNTAIDTVVKLEKLNDDLATSIKQRDKLDEEIDLLQTQDSELIANGVKDREVKEAQLSLTNRQVAEVEKDIDVKERTTVIAKEQSDKDIESKTIQDGLVQRNIANAEKDVEAKVAQIEGIKKDNLVKDQKIKTAQAEVSMVERQVTKVEKEIDVAERQTIVAEAQSDKQLEKLDTDIAVNARQVAMLEEQRASLVRNDGFKDRMTNVEENLKIAQTSINERQASKIEAETESVRDENGRRELMNKKDREVKDAQKTKTYRDAMLAEQQQLLLANQTSYEAEKTQTLKDNTKANMLIRTIDSGVSEINGYLSNSLDVPANLVNIVASARSSLVALAG